MDQQRELAELWRTAAVGTIQQVVEVGHRLLGCSILLGDPILSVAAAVCPLGEEGWTWEDYIQAGYAPDFMREVSPPADKQVVLSPQCSGWRSWNGRMEWFYILLDLRTSKGPSYHLVLNEDGATPLAEEEPLLSAFCEALLAVVQRSDGAFGRLSEEQFLGWLLTGDHREDRMLGVRAGLMDFPTEGYFRLLTIDIGGYRPRGSSVSTVGGKLEQLMGGISTIYGQRLVILERLAREEDGEDPGRLLQLEELLAQVDLVGARSRMFYTLRDVPDLYQQTEDLLRLRYCGEGRHLLDFSRMNLYLLVSRLPEEDRRETSCHPVVRRLAELDRESKFGYVDTLKAYLQSGQRAAIACSRLHIHRNTLDYRLRKMEEQVPIDWTDGDTLFQLYFSICLLEVSGGFGQKGLSYTGESKT
jgi:hypothetical protein